MGHSHAGHSHDHAHGHTHDHGDGGADQQRRLTIALTITALLLVAEFVGGWLANSLALLADAGHLLTDVAALGLSLLVAILSRRPETPRRTYGYRRLEILAAFANGSTLLLICALIIWEAVARLRHPEPVAGPLMFAVGLLGLVANLASAKVLHPASHDNLNMRGAYLHILGDVLGFIGTIVAALIIWRTGWLPADTIASDLRHAAHRARRVGARARFGGRAARVHAVVHLAGQGARTARSDPRRRERA